MVSFLSPPVHFFSSLHFPTETRSNLPALAFSIHPRRRRFELGFLGWERRASFGNSVLLIHGNSFSCSGILARRKRRIDAGDPALEAEIFEFMKKSENPSAFPSKKDLIDAGRVDLVEGIVKQGGWLSLGWDLSEDEDEKESIAQEEKGEDRVRVPNEDLNSLSMKEASAGSLFDGDSRILQSRFDGEDSLADLGVGSSGIYSSFPPSSSGRGVRVEEDTGIEGILSRLEKERSRSYCIGSREKERQFQVITRENQDDFALGISADHDSMGSMLKPDTWRKWSTLRASYSDSEFEAAEIGEHVGANDKIIPKVADNMRYVEVGKKFGDKELDNKQIRSHLQSLEGQLASVLHVLRSRTDIIVSNKDSESSLEELHKVSDAWEFQETEIMNARDKLRSIRAKLAVLEGKMALGIIEVQKNLELKQKRVNEAHKALSLLRNACIVWSNPASEVLLSGSFDGWTSQRRMEKSRSGIFSLYLKLYPGRYEVKFVVDGVWMIDPLRPIVHNNGYENNLVVVD